MPLYRETLASYRTRFLRVVKDANQQYFNAGAAPGTAASYVDIDAWINEAIRWRDLWSGGSRAYKHEQALAVGFDEYDLTTMFPTETILDIPYIWVIVGNARYKISERPLDEVTKFARGLIRFTSIPVVWCRYGATKLFIATAPASSLYTADFDVTTLSVQFASDAPNTVDPLPFPYTEPVPYMAAALGKEQWQRQYEEAERLRGQATEKLRDIEGARVGELPSPIGPRGR